MTLKTNKKSLLIIKASLYSVEKNYYLVEINESMAVLQNEGLISVPARRFPGGLQSERKSNKVTKYVILIESKNKIIVSGV